MELQRIQCTVLRIYKSSEKLYEKCQIIKIMNYKKLELYINTGRLTQR